MSIEIKAWKCEICGKAWLDKSFADKCCADKKIPATNTCRVCGCEVEPPWLICKPCREKERFEKAKKVKWSEYKVGYLWDEVQDRYFRDKEELEEKYYDDAYDEQGKDPKVEYPTWCYGCVEIPFKINLRYALESAEEEMHEDFDREREIVELRELLDYVDAWNAKQDAKSYVMDYETVILLNE